jgi:hypothetical protein
MENDGNVYGWRMLDMQKVVAHPKARALWGTSSWIVKSLKKMLRTKTEFPTTWYFFCYFQSAMKLGFGMSCFSRIGL